ncbi:MAG: UDP-3-O-(3-hydroxymyristoyl)glucosamine N-acyltransferase [Thiomargarita sp.]|nr:UDP-3-O-(3-hydroxymyristoyl)glucosamine N-acyltransferase [Thiomargarita sp.]
MKIPINLSELATHIGAELESEISDIPIEGIASLSKADHTKVSFFSNRLYRDDLSQTNAAAVILKKSDRRFCKRPMLVMENPYLGYARAVSLFTTPITHAPGIHHTAWVSPDAELDETVSVAPQAVIEAGARIGRNVFIGPGCVVGSGVEMGDDCQLIANVTLCTGTRLGKRVIIHPGVVIGADGFGNANDGGKWVKVPQIGGVLIANDVEIGANTTIDKGALEDTVIGEGVKLDNLIQIGHNVHIGKHTAMAGAAGSAGSARIGSYCMIGGGVRIAGHIELVDHVHITGGSLVHQSVREAGVYSSGVPLDTNRHWHRNFHRFKKLDDMARRLKTLEGEVKKEQDL